MVEHLTFNQGVGGSIPPRLTIFFRNIRSTGPLGAPLVPTSGAKRSSASAVEPLNPLSVPSGKLPSVALQEALRGFFQRIDRARQRALASRGSEEEGYEEPARLKFSGAAAFYVGSTGRGLRVQFEPGNESPAGAFITGMVLRVADLLTRVDLSRVKRCPECKRLFLEVRHQRFDTPQCSLRDRVRRFRTNRAGKKGRRRARG